MMVNKIKIIKIKHDHPILYTEPTSNQFTSKYTKPTSIIDVYSSILSLTRYLFMGETCTSYPPSSNSASWPHVDRAAMSSTQPPTSRWHTANGALLLARKVDDLQFWKWMFLWIKESKVPKNHREAKETELENWKKNNQWWMAVWLKIRLASILIGRLNMNKSVVHEVH